MAALHCFVSKFLAPAKQANPRVVTVLGGPHASTAPERCVSEGWDYVVASDQGGGGGEPGFLEVLRRIEKAGRPEELAPHESTSHAGRPRPLQMAPSLAEGACHATPEAHERIVRVPSRDPAFGLYQNDRWPHPARDLIDFPSYHYELDGRRYASVVTQAGCPFRCSFCAHHEGYTKLVLRSPAHVEGEVRALKSAYPFVGGIQFYDDEVNVRPDFVEFLDTAKRLHEELDLTYRAFWKSGWKWNQGPASDDLFRKVADAGFTRLCTGAEHADPDVLRLVGKGATVEDNTAFVRKCVRYGIKPKVFTMVGLPGETPDSAEKLARWLEAMADEGLNDGDVTICTPTAGTPLYEQADKWLASGLIQFDLAELHANTETVNYKGTPGQYKSFVWNKHMTRGDMVRARDMIERRFRKAASLPALVGGKDDG